MQTFGVFFLLWVVWAAASITGSPPREPSKGGYIETDRGLTAARTMHCLLGLLVTSDGRNILDENNKPITCSGYIKLTKAEAAKWVAK